MVCLRPAGAGFGSLHPHPVRFIPCVLPAIAVGKSLLTRGWVCQSGQGKAVTMYVQRFHQKLRNFNTSHAQEVSKILALRKISRGASCAKHPSDISTGRQRVMLNFLFFDTKLSCSLV